MRWPTNFYRDFQHHRDAYGETAYDELDMLKAFLPTLDRYLTGDDEQAGKIKLQLLSEVEIGARRTKRDKNQQEFTFMYDDHVALGGRMRIKRGCMNLEQHAQRRDLIDDNYTAQGVAWREESLWLRDGAEALKDRPGTTRRRDVLNEDGSVRMADPVT